MSGPISKNGVNAAGSRTTPSNTRSTTPLEGSMKRSAPIFGIAAILLLVTSGCSSNPASTPDATVSASAPTGPSTSLPTSLETPTKETLSTDSHAPGSDDPTRQAWADTKVAQWWEVEGAEDFSEFYHPFHLIESWRSPAAGELVFDVNPAITDTDGVYLNAEGPANDLYLIAAVMWEQLDRKDQARDLESITVQTIDGERTEIFTREDQYGPKASGDHDPSTQEWADEMVDLWLKAEGVQSVQGLLGPYDLIQSWEATGYGELTLYTDPQILDDPTHAEDGPGVLYGLTALVWQRLYCGAPELQAVTVTTTDGQASYTAPREDWSPSRQVYGETCRS